VHPERYRDKGLGFGYQWWVWHEPDPNGPFVGAYTYIADWGQFLTVLPKLDMVVAHQVIAGWYGAPERSVSWEAYEGVLERIVAARNGLD
jgi:CubicO group peptidase (beta-lactamase class C family)